ncbi:MAG: hypothetical protein ACTS4X_00520 [Candidatus Hodgkinia cicadicola]
MKMEGVSKSQWKFKITETLFNVFRKREKFIRRFYPSNRRKCFD